MRPPELLNHLLYHQLREGGETPRAAESPVVPPAERGLAGPWGEQRPLQ